MKSRNLACLAVLASSVCMLAGVGSVLGAAPAAAQGNPAAQLNPSLPETSFPECGCEQQFAILKLQEVAGSGSGFTPALLTGAIGQTVNYEIVVTNTGPLDESFSEFADPQCDAGTIAGGSGTNPVAPGESTTFTCSRLLTAAGVFTNEATVTATAASQPPLTHTSNRVVVEVPSAPFTIEKRQRIAGSASAFASSPLVGEIGQTVEYQIVVTNTGQLPETFSEFTDPQCDPGTIAGGPGTNLVAPGESATYTCSHVLTSAGPYTNEATVTATPPLGPPITQTSNQVVVEVPSPPAPSGPAFTIEKRQKIGGTASAFTASVLSGAIGQTVEYQIIVKNTGNTPLTFSTLEDPKCDPGSIEGGPGVLPLAPGDSTTFTCHHLLGGAGTYTNQAAITGTPSGGSPMTQTSNRVEVVVPATAAARQTPEFTIEKSQKIHGSAGAFTTAPLEGAIGQVVDYQIVVKNTGPVVLTFTGFVDSQCDQGTIAGAPAEVSVGAGGSTTYTCSRVLVINGTFLNQASVTGTAQGEPPLTKTSNQVEVKVPSQEVKPCTAALSPLRGANGPKRTTFTVQVGSGGIKQITFYLDGRKLKTFKHAQAKHGKFTVTIDPRKLSHGRHRLSIKGTMIDPVCGPFARASSFVRPFAASRPVFTG